jgi:hypothetical protein
MSTLTFPTTIVDGWPPVSSETLQCERLSHGFRIASIPFFIADISADDIVEVIDEQDGYVWEWRHVRLSDRSTLWIMNNAECDLEAKLAVLRELGCRVEYLDQLNLIAVDIPKDVKATIVDECFSGFKEADVALAYPSWRHTD